MSIRHTVYIRIYVLVVCFMVPVLSLNGQCSSFTSSFLYGEIFETSDGGWFAEGWIGLGTGHALKAINNVSR